MKIMILAVLLTIMQASVPVPQKAADGTSRAAQSVQGQPKLKNNPALQSPPLPKQSEAAHNDKCGDNSSTQNAEQSIRVRGLPPVSITRDWADWISWAFGGFLTLVGLLTLRALRYQAEEMKRTTEMTQNSIKIQKDQQRARLFVEPSYAENSFDFQRPSVMEDGTILIDRMDSVVNLKIFQYGPTQAFNVSGRAILVITSSKSFPPLEKMPIINIPPVIPGTVATQTYQIFANILVSANQRQIDEIQEERMFAHLSGVITYNDIFDDSHRTTFRYLWKIERSDASGEGWKDESYWDKCGSEGDNYAT